MVLENNATTIQLNRNKLDDKGFTLVEMITTFVLLGIFLVAVTRMISYTITLYHETQGAALGMQVSDMIATRIQSEIEASTEIVSVSGNAISIKDRNGVQLDICAEADSEADPDADEYIVFKYGEIPGEEGELLYEAHDWKFDKNAYMGYSVNAIDFKKAEDENPEYDSKVIHMSMTLTSRKYGDYSSEYYMRAFRATTDEE